MNESEPTPRKDVKAFQLGDWHIEPSLRTISKGTRQIYVEPRVMQLLTYLVAAEGRVVSRQELLDAVWSDVVVNDEAVSRAVSELRKALDDDTKEPRYVQTIRKSGYRLLVPVPRSVRVRPRVNGTTGLIGATFVGLLLLVFFMRSPDRESALSVHAPLLATILTSYPGREIDPAIDAAGGRVVFAWNGGSQGKDYDLYVRRIGTDDDLVRLTETPGFEGHPAWSPDGNAVAFVRSSGDKVAVWSVSWSGGDERKLFDLDGWSFGLDWFPDGRSLVVSQAREDGTHRLIRVSFDSVNAQDLTFPDTQLRGDYKPAVSPDGASVAFVRTDHLSSQNIVVVNFLSGEETMLTQVGGNIRGLDWSPDSRSVIYATDHGDGFGLWSVDVESGAADWLPLNDHGISNPVMASNGRLVYESVSYQENLWGLDLESDPQGLHADRLNTHSTMRESFPAHSPDGNWLALVSNRSGQRTLLLSSIETSEQRVLTPAAEPVAASPIWSPDSAQIAISLVRDDIAIPYVINVDTGRKRPLLKKEINAIPVDWAGDGQSVYLAVELDGQWDIWTVRINDGELEQITADNALFAAEDDRGERLYYTTAGSANLYELLLGESSADGVTVRSIGEISSRYRLPWALVAGSFYSIIADDDEFKFARFNRSMGSMEIIATPPGLHFASRFSVSPDGKRLVYSRMEESESDLKSLML